MLSSVRVRAHLHAGQANDTASLDPEPPGGDGRFHAPEFAPMMPKLQALADRCAAYAAAPGGRF